MTDHGTTTTTVNTTDLDDGLPSLRAIASALDFSAFALPDGFSISGQDYRDCLRPGARRGEVLVEGYGPRRVIEEWDDDPDDVEPGQEPQHHVETEETLWGFRIRIDQIGRD
jgi:hypothetical protein